MRAASFLCACEYRHLSWWPDDRVFVSDWKKPHVIPEAGGDTASPFLKFTSSPLESMVRVTELSGGRYYVTNSGREAYSESPDQVFFGRQPRDRVSNQATLMHEILAFGLLLVVALSVSALMGGMMGPGFIGSDQTGQGPFGPGMMRGHGWM